MYIYSMATNWILIPIICIYTLISSHIFLTGKLDCYSLRLWTACGLCRCCRASGFAELTSRQVTQGNEPRLRITIFGSQRTQITDPRAATTHCSEELKCAGSYTDRPTWRAKNRPALLRTISQYANTLSMKLSQELGCSTLNNNDKKIQLKNRMVLFDCRLKIVHTTLILMGDRSCFALGVSSCRQVSWGIRYQDRRKKTFSGEPIILTLTSLHLIIVSFTLKHTALSPFISETQTDLTEWPRHQQNKINQGIRMHFCCLSSHYYSWAKHCTAQLKHQLTESESIMLFQNTLLL